MLDLTALKKPAADSAYIADTDSARFEKDVLAVSNDVPVIVDFWAPWCGPCKQLMPLLEKAVTAAAGRVRMVKVNIDQSPDLAQIFRVQSVPTVYAFHKGQPVDGFAGVQPASAIDAFVKRLAALAGGGADDAAAPDVSDLVAAGDKAFADADWHNAIAAYSTAFDAAPQNAAALAGIGWCLYAMGELEGLKELVATADPSVAADPAMQGLRFICDEIAAAPATPPAGDTLAARYDAARHHLAAGRADAAIDALLSVVRADREWEEQKARQYLLRIFEALGPRHPLVAPARRQLSSILFS